MIQCRMCNLQLKRVTKSHLNKHGITTKQYLQQFPDAKLFSDELKYAYGKSARENNPMKKEENATKVSNKLKGVPKSETHKEKLSIAKKGISWGNHSEEHKEKMKIISKDNMLKRLATGWKPPEWADERRKTQSLKMMGNKNGVCGEHNKGKKLNLSGSQRVNRSKKRVEYMQLNKTPKTNTSIELAFKTFCENNNVKYIHQHPIHDISGSWLYDFLIPELNLLVEVDGEYWHSSLKQINRDIIKNKIAREHGYSILRLSNKNLKFDLIFCNIKIIEKHTNILMKTRIYQSKKLSGKDIP